MHVEAFIYISQHSKIPAKRVLEIGSRNVNGSIRAIFPKVEYLGIDREPGRDVDVIGDGATYVPPWSPDLIITCETLEHADNWREVLTHIAQIMAVGGTLLATMATHGRAEHSVDGGPLRAGEYYGNVDPVELKAHLKLLFASVEVETHLERGDLYVCASGPRRAQPPPS